MPSKPVLTRRSFLYSSALVAAAAAVGISGCSQEKKSNVVRIGTMPTEDILPMWVAESEGMFKEAGLEAEIIVFDSAQNLSAAITAGEVDLAMTDTMRAVKLCEAGTPLIMEWVTLGTEPGQGRFGVLTSPNSGMRTLADLQKGTMGVGVAANTVPEYVFDKLCEQQGIDPASIKASEVPSLPDRYSLMASGKLDAAALPGSMLALGQATGMVLIADDSTGENISQSVMVARSEFAKGDGAKTIETLRKVWDKAASAINAAPEKYRALLVQKANLNEKVADTYPISSYPLALTTDGKPAYPQASLVDPVLAWMKKKGYSTKNVSYNQADGTFSIS